MNSRALAALATLILIAQAAPALSYEVMGAQPATLQKLEFCVAKLTEMRTRVVRLPNAETAHMKRAMAHLDAAIEELTAAEADLK